jgi:phenylacetate-CoA ligase
MSERPDFRTALPGLVWPAFPAPYAAQKLALLFQIEREQWRSSDEIAAAQLRQASEVVAFAARTVPHYRDCFGTGIAKEALDAESWARLPILTRNALAETGSRLRSTAIPARHGRSFELKTSGSTGMPVEVLGTDLTQMLWQVFCLRDHIWHGRDFRQKLVVIRYLRDPALKTPAGLRGRGWGPATDDVVTTGPSIQFDIQLDAPHLARILATEQPGYLLTHPSMMLGLARYCLENGLAVPGLREARTLGESSPDSLRGACREVWGVPVVDMYTCQEAGYLGLQCPEHDHLHVQSENVLLEVVDADGRPCRPGEIGRVLITSLNNFATPLIRYELGDYAEVGAPCPCGRGLPVLKRVMGRYRNLVTLPDGTQRWPLMGYDSGRLREIAPIEAMQMVQTGRDEIDVRLVTPRPLDEKERSALAAFIQGNLGHPFDLRFDYVASIRNPANGKVEQFLSRLEPRGT